VIRSPRTLYAGAFGSALLALALRLAPAPHPGAVTPLEVRQPARGPALRTLNENAAPYTAIVVGNIFSPTRTAPPVRFTPNRRRRPSPSRPAREFASSASRRDPTGRSL